MSLIWAALLYPINDITTTPERPPAFIEIAKLEENKGRDYTYTSDLPAKQKKLYPDLAPVVSAQSPSRWFARVVETAKKQPGWKIVNVDEASFRLELVAVTSLLKFADDVVVEVRPEKNGSSLHMRSKSRLGKSDLGANFKRISEFLKAVQ